MVSPHLKMGASTVVPRRRSVYPQPEGLRIMPAVLSTDNRSKGFNLRRLRLYHRLTERELAAMAGVSEQDVMLFEDDLPLQLGARCKILKVAWAMVSPRVSQTAGGTR